MAAIITPCDSRQSGLDAATERQRQVFGFIESALTSYTSPPSVRELGELCNPEKPLRPNAVQGHLDSLIKRGLLTRSIAKARSLGLVFPPVSEADRKLAAIEKTVTAPAAAKTKLGKVVADILADNA